MKFHQILPIASFTLAVFGIGWQNSTASPLAVAENELESRLVRLEANFFKFPDSGDQNEYYAATHEASTLLTNSGNLNDFSTPNAVQKTCVKLLTDYDKADERLFKDINRKNINDAKVNAVETDELAVYEDDLQELFTVW